MSSRLNRLVRVVALVIGVALVSVAAASAYTFTALDEPNGPTTAIGINDQGDIVGEYVGGTPCVQFHGYVRHAGTYMTLADPAPGATHTTAHGINDPGVIVGYYSTSPCVNGAGPTGCPHCHGFLLRNGVYTTLDAQIPGVTVTGTRALGINPRGDVVGRYDDSRAQQHGFLLRGNVYTTIDFPGARITRATGINARGDIVGSYGDSICASFCHPFLRSSQGNYTTPNVAVAGATTPIFAWGINARGDIVGTYTDSQNQTNTVPYVLSGGATSILPVPGTGRDAQGINAGGDIVGSYTDAIG